MDNTELDDILSAVREFVRMSAKEAGITLVAVARADGFEVFSHNERILA